ncbi:MAG: glycosyltransferase [Flavobacteriales bacterium]|nr:glycosyltransferase [Flavobacteriales bacterium]
MIRELSKRHEIVLFCLADEKVHPRAEEELKHFCSEIYIHRIPLITRLWKLFTSFFSKKPFQVEYFYTHGAQQEFDAFLEENLPQHIFCQLIRTAEYVKSYRTIPKTLDYMDAFSAGMEKMANSAAWPMRIFMQNEQRRLDQYERSIAGYFDHHLIISAQDAKCIAIDRPMHVLANGIDPSFFEHRSIEASRDLLFTGNMSYRPNVESARFLAIEVMPLVWKRYPDLQLTLAGANPSSAVQALKGKKVEVTGWVDDIFSVYASSRIFVAPMLINSGLQNKLLEAMASGLPSVTTQLANNALGATDGKEILIANDAEETSEAIFRLIEDSSFAQQMAKNGQSYVTGTYSWETEVERMESIMQMLS